MKVRSVPFNIDRLLWFYRVIRKQMIIQLNPRVFRKPRIQLNNQNKRSKQRRRSLPANRHSLKLNRLLLLLKNYTIQIIHNTSICFQTSERSSLFWYYLANDNSKFFTHIVTYEFCMILICRYWPSSLFLCYFCNITFTWYLLYIIYIKCTLFKNVLIKR